LLDPSRPRTASNLFKKVKTYFNSKTAKSEEPDTPSNETSNSELGDDFFGNIEETSIKDFLPEGLSLDTITPSRKTLSPEETKRLHGGPITVRQVDESDMTRPFLRNPAKALQKTKTMLRGQKSLE
jgi:hypothetical protein